MLTIAEIGVDHLVVDEAQEFRKLSFATNMANLKGVQPDGSQRAWDLYVKANFIDGINPGRALVMASGTPITNTLAEMFTLQRFLQPAALKERGLHEFDAWAATFGDSRTELELQPSGTYKPVTRFAEFVNVADLMAMFRSFADVVSKADLRGLLKLPRIEGGTAADRHRRTQPHLQVVSAGASPAHQGRSRRASAAPQKGDDILLSVITDGRHAAIDLRFVLEDYADEADNKLNALINNVHRIWRETRFATYRHGDGTPYAIRGAAQMIFSDLGTINVEATRGFSAYRWIKRPSSWRLGVPASEQIAFMQDFKKSAAKQRLFGDVNAGKVTILIGSSETMGTGVNAQAAAEGAAPPRRAVAAQPHRAAGRPHRAAGQPERGDRAVCLRDAGQHRRHDVAEQRAQAALHQRGAVRRPLDPAHRGRRLPGQPVRHGQGDRLGRPAADAEGRAGSGDRPAAAPGGGPSRRPARRAPAAGERPQRGCGLAAPDRRDRAGHRPAHPHARRPVRHDGERAHLQRAPQGRRRPAQPAAQP